MKIQYISDIHLEFLNLNEVQLLISKIIPKADICILAGDIGNPYSKYYRLFLEYINNSFKKTFLIAGNHEYYKNSIIETKLYIKAVCESFLNISFLDNSFEDYEGSRFIGTTLWTEITNPNYTVNDIKYINNFSIYDYNKLFYEAREFLEKSIVPNSIIITHHLPLNDLTHPKYMSGPISNYNQWFNANLDCFVKNNTSNIKGWFYGHTHTRSIQQLYGVNFYCNPLGYPKENNYKDINIVCEV